MSSKIKVFFSLPRNPIIAKIFRTIRLSENIGSGFYKMREGWKSFYKSMPEIGGDFDFYKIEFRFKQKDLKKLGEKDLEKIHEKLGEKL